MVIQHKKSYEKKQETDEPGAATLQYCTVAVVFGTAQTTELEQFLNIRLYTVHSSEEATMQQQCTGYEVI